MLGKAVQQQGESLAGVVAGGVYLEAASSGVDESGLGFVCLEQGGHGWILGGVRPERVTA